MIQIWRATRINHILKLKLMLQVIHQVALKVVSHNHDLKAVVNQVERWQNLDKT